MIVVKGNHTEIEGTGEELMSECVRVLYMVINAGSKALDQPFTKTAKWMMKTITKAVLEANEAAERENI